MGKRSKEGKTMKIIGKQFPDYVNGKRRGYYTEHYSFRRQGTQLVVTQWVTNEKNTYNRTLNIRCYEDTEEGRTKANDFYKRLRANGYEVER